MEVGLAQEVSTTSFQPTKMKTRSQTARQFGQNITNLANQNRGGSRQKRRLEVNDDRPLKKRRQEVDSDGDVDMTKPSSASPSQIEDKSKSIAQEPKIGAWDCQDVENELACVEYMTEIMDALHANELHWQISEDFMRHQKDINARMRTILLDWLVEVSLKFKLRDATFYLAVNILDRYLATKQVGRAKLQLTGCASLWVASKYHEIYAPEMGDFVYMSDNAFGRDELLQAESDICQALEFSLTVPTPLTFAERFLKIACFNLKDKQKIFVTNFSYYLIEHSLMDYKLSRELPSSVAAGAIAFGLLVARIPIWDSVMAEQTTYSLDALVPIMEALSAIVTNTKCKHRAIRKKYSHSKHGKVEAVVKKYAEHMNVPKLIAVSRRSSTQ